ncbi:MAG TPA: hypothetical protein V6D08_16345 [Candidatus Obscuribacterales bacterium]
MHLLRNPLYPILVGAALCLPLHPVPVLADSPADILADWKHRENAMRSAKYEITGKVVLPKGAYSNNPHLPAHAKNKLIPDKDYVYEKTMLWVIDFANNRLRKDYQDQTFNFTTLKFHPLAVVQVFDGRMTKRHFPRQSNPSSSSGYADMGLVKNGNTVDIVVNDYPVFLARGFIGVSKTLSAAKKPTTLSPTPAAFTITERAPQMCRNVQCRVVRIRHKDDPAGCFEELFVDRTLTSAVLRMDVYTHGVLSDRLDIVYDDKGMVPQKWTSTLFEGDSRVSASEQLTVKRAWVNPELQAGDFDIPLTPGMRVIVGDAVTYQHADYKVTADGSLVPIGAEAPLVRQWLPHLLVAGIATLVALVARRLVKRFRPKDGRMCA